MKEFVAVLYVALFTLITWPLRYKNSRGTAEEDIKDGQASNYKMLQHLSRVILRITGVKLDVKGLDNLTKHQTNVYMGTHKSYFDVVIMIALIDKPAIFIGKKELEKTPLIGTWVKAVGAITMDRSDMRQSLKVILEAIEELKAGYSVAIFPEGTRSKDREILDFKAGSFKLATKSETPIVPIVMQDTFKLLEENSRLRSAKIDVNIGEPIDIESLTDKQVKTLHKYTRDYMKDLSYKNLK